jgi:hypothetical protein
MLAWLRSLGGYGRGEYAGLRSEIGRGRRLAALLVTCLPVRLANALVASYCALGHDPALRMKLYGLVTAPSASAWARFVAARHGVTP